MLTMVHWMFSRSTVLFWLAFCTIYDIIFTYVILSLYGGVDPAALEQNLLFRHFIRTYGVDWTLFVILPLVMLLVILLGYRFWNAPLLKPNEKLWRRVVRKFSWRLWRGYLYLLFLARIGLFFYNLYLVFILTEII